MNSFELNKIFGAILGALVFVMGIGFLAEGIYRPIQDRGATYLLPEPELAEGEAPVEAPGVDPIAVRMQEASASAGEQLINRCQACHDYSPANTNRAGPGIYDVLGEIIAHHDDFNYSGALVELREAGEHWTYENMDAFLESPRNFAPGTNMTFAGLSNPMDRANLIAFLRELSDDPIPLPEADAADEATQDAAEDAVTEDAVVEDEPTEAQEAGAEDEDEAAQDEEAEAEDDAGDTVVEDGTDEAEDETAQ